MLMVPMEGIRSEVLKVVLLYCYTDKADIQDKEITEEYLSLAEDYKLAGFKEMCFAKLRSSVNQENTVTLFRVACHFSDQILKTKCMECILAYFSTISKSKEYLGLDKKLMLEILATASNKVILQKPFWTTNPFSVQNS